MVPFVSSRVDDGVNTTKILPKNERLRPKSLLHTRSGSMTNGVKLRGQISWLHLADKSNNSHSRCARDRQPASPASAVHVKKTVRSPRWQTLENLGTSKLKTNSKNVGLKIDNEICFEKSKVAEKCNHFFSTVASSLHKYYMEG